MKAALVGALCGVALVTAGAVAWADQKFEHLSVRLERNVTDNDHEIVLEATSGEVGMTSLKVAAPDGRVIIDFKAPDTKLGIRHFNLETPEPKNLASLQADFPAGDYTFTASLANGARLSGKTSLSHKLPATTSFVRPRPDEANVATKGFRVQWGAGRNLASHVLAIENEDTGAKLVQAKLPGTATGFSVPDGVLSSGTRYKVSIGAVTADGNATYAEAAFTTAK